MGLVVASDPDLREVGLHPEPVKDLARITSSLENRTGAGLQLAIFKDGRLALSLWLGRDVFTDRPIGRDSLLPLLSATKGLASLVVLHLHHQGFFEWSDPVAKYWPNFAQHGKEHATVSDVLSHRLGLASVTTDWRHWTDREVMRRLIEDARPEWVPGSRYGYHGGSWGVIVGELVHRWTGRDAGVLLRDLLPGSTGDCYMGLPAGRYEDFVRLPALGPDEGYNRADILATCQPSGGGVASAESLASVYNLLAFQGQRDHDTLWLPEAQEAATLPRSNPDKEIPAARPELRCAWGMGFMVHPTRTVFGSAAPGRRTVGHPGASGSIGWADPASRLAVAMTLTGTERKLILEQFRAIGDHLQLAMTLTR